jgi:predicted dehydrogenase
VKRWRTAVVGFGRIAAGYADDPAQSRWYPFASHAQALRAHPAFDWVAVVDPARAALSSATTRWGITEVAASVDDLANAGDIEVLVLATPPDARQGVLDRFPRLRAVITEKPLGSNLREAEEFVAECRRRQVLVAVNLPRRYDADLRGWAAGGMQERVGSPMAVFGTYGNGIRNNGTHLVDLVRMLFGTVASAGVVSGTTPFHEGPIAGDLNFPFSLVMTSGLAVMVQPLRFAHYREVSLDIWAERGRLQLVHEGLTVIQAPVAANRQLSGAQEIAHDQPTVATSSVGRALYGLYENLAEVLDGRAALHCSGDEGLETMRVVEGLVAAVSPAGRS